MKGSESKTLLVYKELTSKEGPESCQDIVGFISKVNVILAIAPTASFSQER